MHHSILWSSGIYLQTTFHLHKRKLKLRTGGTGCDLASMCGVPGDGCYLKPGSCHRYETGHVKREDALASRVHDHRKLDCRPGSTKAQFSDYGTQMQLSRQLSVRTGQRDIENGRSTLSVRRRNLGVSHQALHHPRSNSAWYMQTSTSLRAASQELQHGLLKATSILTRQFSWGVDQLVNLSKCGDDFSKG
ncbi:hypothetical protein BDW74DRAFT_49000 [Aspergillus multicolor]|uniref:uncharacterized protein n=1 Tax=Aspergillus multicolor TaxID=41759 RepID=UPI003CCE1124